MSSEWEEFCESMGMNPGSQNDYVSWVNSLDEPVEKPPSPTPTEEIEPSLSKEELLCLIVDGFCQGELELSIEAQSVCARGGEYYIEWMDNHRDEPEPNLSLCIAYEHWVPITFFIDVLRENRVPVLLHRGEWLAWDERNQRLKHSPRPLPSLWSEAATKRLREAPRSTFNKPVIVKPQTVEELRLESLLHSALLSTDHATKPMLVHRDHLDDALYRREFEFEETRRIHRDSIDQYSLVYYDSAGRPSATPLVAAAELGFPVTTRISAYRWTEGDLDPVLNTDAQMIAGAFFIATRCNPNELAWFTLRDRGTIFQAPIERIEGLVHPYGATLQHALVAAETIKKLASEIGTVYLTGGGHPLSMDAVTTPELYLHALEMLQRMQYEVQYISSDNVTLVKHNMLP